MKIVSYGDALIIQADERLDASTNQQMKEHWQRAASFPFLIVDLENTTFIDSVGLATLVSGLKLARQRGGELILVNPSENVRIIFDLTHMDRVFQIAPTIQAALALAANRKN
ncbi:MAG: STAS domain-containing protein [Aggregatilineales bacterium]